METIETNIDNYKGVNGQLRVTDGGTRLTLSGPIQRPIEALEQILLWIMFEHVREAELTVEGFTLQEAFHFNATPTEDGAWKLLFQTAEEHAAK